MTHPNAGALRALTHHSIVVPTDRTDRDEERHLSTQHAIYDLLEADL